MHNPRIIAKTRRPITAIQLLRRHHPIQHFFVVNRARANHPESRLARRLDPHDAAAPSAGVGRHVVPRVGGAGVCFRGAGEDLELKDEEHVGVSWVGVRESGVWEIGKCLGGEDYCD